ncbi:GM18465 [Drosophila sechellia]|uniref:GM18465 n=1 Tax=Drosophila sechellia TaxID=7238 RepID=B4I378_DROSE|nr:GM18465 [Drosophila sechellia]
MPAPPATVKPATGHTTKLNNGKSSNSQSNHTLSNSIAQLSDSRTNLTVNTPTTCQRLSEMFRRSIASSTQSSSRENTYEERPNHKSNIFVRLEGFMAYAPLRFIVFGSGSKLELEWD